jgi:hypothetical protein
MVVMVVMVVMVETIHAMSSTASSDASPPDEIILSYAMASFIAETGLVVTLAIVLPTSNT